VQIQPFISSLLEGASAALAVAASGAVSESDRSGGSNRLDAPQAAAAGGGSRFDTADELDLSPAAEQAAVGRLTEEQQQQVQRARLQLREQQQAERRAATDGSQPTGSKRRAVFELISDQEDASVGLYFDAVA
jgi:hypothetical protein